MPTKKTAEKKARKVRSKSKPRRAKAPPADKAAAHHFPVVGLGASAGGLDALKAFFAAAPPDSGMAFIVVVHLAPKQPSLMAELLQKVTQLPICTARDGQLIEPDHIYVVPPDKVINVFHDRLQLLEVLDKHATLPIDLFLRSLAQDQGPRAVAVILSGTGTDGTLGAKEIKAYDGLVLVQSQQSADYDGMPRSAINSGVADVILAPREMPQKLVHYFAHHDVAMARKPAVAYDQRDWLNKIFAILRTKIGHDFSQYKVNTLLRRISRRMGLNQIEDHEQYVRYLRQNPAEVEALFRELLIGVTNFFRDAESFETLKTSVLPELLDRLQPDAVFRAWIPGCSTGEEVYSLAMVIREALGANPKRINLQLFGTDIDNFAIEKAREGVFPVSIAADVKEERLKRFFTREGELYRIRKEIRDCAVFSVQDLIKDPPFSRLHLLCCRNLLIYLDGQAQKKLLPLFHYTLVPEGILMLGSSETIGGFATLFDTLDKKWKIFKRREVPKALRQQVDFPSGLSAPELEGVATSAAAATDQKVDIGLLTRAIVLEEFAPTALLIDAKGQILHLQGRTGKYLEVPSGPPTQNILDLAREGLRIELSSALREARSSNHPVTRTKINVKTNGDPQTIDLHVAPLHTPSELAGRFLVVFKDVEPTVPAGAQPSDQTVEQKESARIGELERELQSTRESHQTTIEELESSNEELKSTNEELQSSNEELQSTNEELESSKEELQSLNEELQTVNAELHSKVEELSAAHDDMRNLLNSTKIATIFVDSNLRIRRFTPEATAIVNLIQSDMGRPLQHVAANLTYEGMIDDLGDVLENLTPQEVEVQSTDGQWYKMAIHPYRTIDNRIDGAVLTFVSIEAQKKAQQWMQLSNLEMEQTWHLIRNAFDMHEDPLVVVDRDGTMKIANQAFATLMQTDPDRIDGRNIFNIKKEIPAQSALEAALKEGRDFQIEAGALSLSQGIENYLIRGQKIRKEDDPPGRMVLHFVKAC